MSYQSKVILNATTSAATSDSFGLANDGQSVTIICYGLAGAEMAHLYMLDPVSGTWVQCLPSTPNSFSNTVNILTLSNMHGSFRVAKDATAAAVGIATIMDQPVLG